MSAIPSDIHKAAVNLVDTLVLERETNGQSHEFMDWAYFMAGRAILAERERFAVKPLTWGETSYGNPEVHSVAGVYRLNRAGDGGWSVSIKTEVLRDSDGRTNFATLDNAKAAAQADYERRIKSALVGVQ